MMNNELTKPQQVQELYGKFFSGSDRFSFTELMKNYVQSEEWRDKSNPQIWNLISKISDDIGAVLTDGIINYTRNVVDVNTCKVPQLIEHSKMLSYGLDNIRNSYDFFPNRIRVLIDIFSINQEYLIGNHKNHILSDEVIKEILTYIRENSKNTNLVEGDILDKLIEDPHGLMDVQTYRNFVKTLFHMTISEAMSAPYSSDEGSTPIVFNILWKERKNRSNILSRLDEYRSWVDRFIWNESEHPLNMGEMQNTLWNHVESVKKQKRMPSRFNPFKIADEIWFNGLNPNNNLTEDELDLVESVMDYHSKPMYDYQRQMFSDDISTQYAYYSELEWCQYAKMVMFVWNNLNLFNSSGLSYDISKNRFVQYSKQDNCLKVVKMFADGRGNLIEDESGNIVLNDGLILEIAEFLCQYAFHIQGIRENLKTIAQKHAMRGTGALLVHLVNDYLIKELPTVRDYITRDVEDDSSIPKLGWEIDSYLRNHGNVRVLEYMDDNEYFNIDPEIDPEKDVRYTERTNARYWQKLEGLGYSDSLGVLTKGQIRDFYKDVLGMGRLQPKKPKDYDYIQDFLVDLFKIGANPIKWRSDEGEFYNPIDDIINKSEEDYGYSKQERMDVQTNTRLRKSQERQFNEYSGNHSILGRSLYDYVNNRIFYWKNVDYSSHVLHPFMYNLKLWNRLDNIIVNGYKDYANDDLIGILSSKVKFDELFGVFGEGRNFWKHNVMDLTGYTTRYEAAVKNEHIDDANRTVSPLTGYDGLFYPDAVQEFIELMKSAEKADSFQLGDDFFNGEIDEFDEGRSFVGAIYSIYWQIAYFDEKHEIPTFYTKWYSHLNYPRDEYQKIAMQLWYWRDRIVELAKTNYPIRKYCLDIQGNSLILVQTFKDGSEESNPFLIDLTIAQDKAESEMCLNRNEHVSFCENRLRVPCELWIRWKSNPIAVPAFDAWYDRQTGFNGFDSRYRQSEEEMVEMGQLTHTNTDCNDLFKVVLKKWMSRYGNLEIQNKLPVFFDMEQSADVLALASWSASGESSSSPSDRDFVFCGKNPIHILSVERTSSEPSEYSLERYSDETQMNESAKEWMFDSYHICHANGNILVPMYNFICNENSEQTAKVRMFVVAAQRLKTQYHSVQQRVSQIHDISIDLNGKVDFDGELSKYRFDSPIMVCRNTNMVFSTYDEDGQNKVKLAFLGQFEPKRGMGSFKVNSCGAKTRYEFDSQSTGNLALMKSKYHKGHDENWDGIADGRRYNDIGIDRDFNSYDSLDKFVFVVGFNPTIDNIFMFDMGWQDGMTASSYNILSDSGCIPHFAYQSLVRYAGGDDGGISYTFRNEHLNGKSHLQFELLGLDDKSLPQIYETMQKMVVDDLTDDCKTILCPSKMVDDIYRIWEENTTFKANPSDPYDSYFSDEYRQWSNPYIDFEGVDAVDGRIVVEKSQDSGLLEIEINEGEEELWDVLKEYHVQVMRTENGNILNEKRYILLPQRVSDMILDVDGEDGFRKCNLDRYQSPMIDGNRYVPTQVMFVGTPNPFNYDEKGERIHSRQEEMQYGNCVKGLDEIGLKIDVVEVNGRKCIKPTLRFVKIKRDNPESLDLTEKENYFADKIDAGQITVIVSRRNMDDIAKYHIINRSSNIYFKGSLPKNGKNQFNYSDFKYDMCVELEECGSGKWKSSENGLEFTSEQVSGQTDEDGNLVQPYYVEMQTDGGEVETWFLQQGRRDIEFRKYPEDGPWKTHQRGSKRKSAEWEHGTDRMENGMNYPASTVGGFVKAYRAKGRAEKYLDYLYVENGGLSFKISEESQSFSEMASRIPSFYIDETTKNKLADLNDVQALSEYSTFIHQSEDPDAVAGCTALNPILVNAVLKYGIEMKDGGVLPSGEGSAICTNGKNPRLIEMGNLDNTTSLELQLEDGELDNLLKIYTNYAKVDDGNGDWHYDLYFNMQNLFNSPFEYISTVTGQPNVLILPDSYLCLTGDKFKRVSDGKDGKWHNEIDDSKIEAIREGGTLSIYGQVKSYSDGLLSDVKTVRLFSYKVYNVSDDKPKFLIEKTYDITKMSVLDGERNSVRLDFSDCLLTVEEDQFVFSDGRFKTLKEDIVVVQPVTVQYKWKMNRSSRLNEISFDIIHDVIDFDSTPVLLGYSQQSRTLRNMDDGGRPYYDRWSDRYMSLDMNHDNGIPRMTLRYDEDSGFNFETIYLKWKLPRGCNLMNTVDRLHGYAFSVTASNIEVKSDDLSSNAKVDVNTGHIVARVHEKKKMYLGLEHSSSRRMNGYVLKGLAESIMEAVNGTRNPTLVNRAISENELRGETN